MATVRKRKWTHKGVEREAWVVSYTDQGGKRRIKTFDRKKEADAFRTTVEGEIQQGIHTAFNESITVAEGIELFIKACEQRQRIGDMTNNGVSGYAYRLRQHVKPRFGALRFSEVTSLPVQDWVNDLLAQGYSAHTVSGAYGSFAILLAFAVRRRWVKRSVLRDEPCRLPKKPKRAAVPSKADILTVLAAAERLEAGENLQTHLNRQATVNIGIFCGLRPGEIYGLQWSDIDWDRGVINVRHNFTKKDGLKSPKTEAGLREVTLVEPVKVVLERIARFNAVRALAEGPGYRSNDPKAISNRVNRFWGAKVVHADVRQQSGFVLRTKMGTPLRAEASIGYWHKLMKNAGLYDHETRKVKFTPHALRHAFASLLIERGLDALNLKSAIGHASVTTTYDIYGHLFPEDGRRGATSHAIAADLGATRTRQERPTTSIH